MPGQRQVIDVIRLLIVQIPAGRYSGYSVVLSGSEQFLRLIMFSGLCLT